MCFYASYVLSGNCMFRSLSDQLYGTMERHMEIRQRIVDYMVQHSDHFSLFIEDDEPFVDYIARMRTSREWGGCVGQTNDVYVHL